MKPNLAEVPEAKYPLTWPKYASPKLDGIRGTTQCGTGLTRSLKPIPNQVVRELIATVQGVDGELGYGDPTAPDFYHATYSAIMTEDGTADGITFYVFDLLDKTKPYLERLAALRSMVLPPMFKVLEQTLINSQEELDAYYASMLAQGYEGAILRNPSAMYKEGRSTAKSQDMLKLKPFKDSDAVILEVEEAEKNNNTAFKNELGRTARSTHAINLEGKGMAGGFKVQMGEKIFHIGAGKLKHDERVWVWENREKVVGLLCTFRHLPIGEKDVPRHGRWIRWRSQLDT